MIAGWIEANPRLEWRWIQWLHFITSGVFNIILICVLQETRGSFAFIVSGMVRLRKLLTGSVILARKAKELRKETGDERYRPVVEPPSLKQLIIISCTRPLCELKYSSLNADPNL